MTEVIFLDVETLGEWGVPVAIGVLYDGDKVMIFDGDCGRRDVVSAFLEYMRSLKDVKVVGFNVLRYDFPVLVKYGGVEAVDVLYSRYVLDLMQALSYVVALFGRRKWSKGWWFKGLSLARLAKCLGVEVYGSGADVAELCARGDKEGVLRHLESDLRATKAVYQALIERPAELVKCYEDATGQ